MPTFPAWRQRNSPRTAEFADFWLVLLVMSNMSFSIWQRFTHSVGWYFIIRLALSLVRHFIIHFKWNKLVCLPCLISLGPSGFRMGGPAFNVTRVADFLEPVFWYNITEISFAQKITSLNKLVTRIQIFLRLSNEVGGFAQYLVHCIFP